MSDRSQPSDPQPIKIIIVEDQNLSRTAYITLFRDYPEIEVIGDAANGKELLECLKTLTPDIIILDVRMPVMDGKEALKHVINLYPKIKVIMLSMHDQPYGMFDFIKQGASAYVKKGDDAQIFIDTIIEVQKKGHYFNNEILALMLEDTKPEGKNDKTELTASEKKIANYLCTGYSHKMIASELNISIGTVNFHCNNIYKKLKINTRVELVNYYNSNGIL